MSLAGAFTTMPLTDVLQWLHDSRRTGLLSITFEFEEVFLHITEGDITGVESDDPRALDVGELCRGRGVIDDAALQQAHATARATGRPLVEVLREEHVFSHTVIGEVRQDGAHELVLNLFVRREGRFHFSPTAAGGAAPLLGRDLGREPPLAQPIATRGVLMEGMRRLDEWHRMLEVFPTEFAQAHALGRDDRFPVLATLAARGEPMPVGELWARRRAERFRILEQLYGAWRAGLVAVDAGEGDGLDEPPPPPVDALVTNGKLLVEEHQYDEAATLLRSALDLDPFRADARDLLHRAREEQLAELYQTIPPYKVPVLRVPRERLARLPLSDRERQVASRISGKWDVGALALMLPVGELETLRILRKLAHVGAITFEG